MDVVFVMATDLAIIIFDLAIFTMMFTLRKDDAAHRLMMYGGCAVIVAAYYISAYRLGWPPSIASALCMSVPSFLLFFALSRYRGSRFVLTFCFVDTVSLMIAFVGRYVGMLLPERNGALASFLVVVLFFSVIVLVGRPYFHRYHELIRVEGAGWGYMAAATVVIYFALIFFAAYPEPMLQRMEYAPSWLVFAAVVLLCYSVFIQSIHKTQRLLREQELFHLAYTDALTGLFNRAAYIEQINKLERAGQGEGICCVMLDCNGLKQINDSRGHQAGDEILRLTAQALRQAFEPSRQIFRIGGDEFAILLPGVTEGEVKRQIEALDEALRQASRQRGVCFSAAAGYAFYEESRSLESALALADRRMYENKNAGRLAGCKAR